MAVLTKKKKLDINSWFLLANNTDSFFMTPQTNGSLYVCTTDTNVAPADSDGFSRSDIESLSNDVATFDGVYVWVNGDGITIAWQGGRDA